MSETTLLPFAIREAGAADRPALLALYRELQAVECALHPNRDDPDKVAETHWRYLERLIDENAGRIWLAEAATGEILGFILVLIETGEPYLVESDRRYGYVSDMLVSEKARKTGIGAVLMQTAERYFRDVGLAQMQVGVLSANRTARGFYESQGFQPYEMVYEKRLDDMRLPEVQQ